MKREDVNLRIAQRSDVEKLLQILPQLTSNPESVSASTPGLEDSLRIFDQMQDQGNVFILVATNGKEGSIVGTLTLVVVPNFTHGGCPWAAIENVVVMRECRGQGIGFLMMEEAFRMAKEFGCYKAQLVSGSKDEQIRFYKRVGMNDEKCHGYKKYFVQK